MMILIKSVKIGVLVVILNLVSLEFCPLFMKYRSFLIGGTMLLFVRNSMSYSKPFLKCVVSFKSTILYRNMKDYEIQPLHTTKLYCIQLLLI